MSASPNETNGIGTTPGRRSVFVIRLTDQLTDDLRKLTLRFGLLNDQETIRYLIAHFAGRFDRNDQNRG